MGRDVESGVIPDTTVVLLGSTGSGKSATGNSIIQRKFGGFKSKRLLGGVTEKCEQKSVVLEDGRVLNVIDTPGLFDSTKKREVVEGEIVRCIKMAKDGIHAALLVVSLAVRFSKEQADTVETLKLLFGEKIVDYIIVVFSNGDILEDDEGPTTLDEFLSDCPEPLKDLLEKCGNRKVVFNNKADTAKKIEQRKELVRIIDQIAIKNGGEPYTQELFLKNKNEAAEKGSGGSKPKVFTEKEMQERIAEVVHEKLKERDEQIVKELQENVHQLKSDAEERKKETTASRDEMRRLRAQVERAQREAEKKRRCVVL